MSLDYKYYQQTTLDEHDLDEPRSKKVSVYGWDAEGLQKRRIAVDSAGKLLLSGLVPVEYDDIALTYVVSGDGAGEIETVVYSSGGSTVATLTLGYDSSNRLNSVVRT